MGGTAKSERPSRIDTPPPLMERSPSPWAAHPCTTMVQDKCSRTHRWWHVLQQRLVPGLGSYRQAQGLTRPARPIHLGPQVGLGRPARWTLPPASSAPSGPCTRLGYPLDGAPTWQPYRAVGDAHKGHLPIMSARKRDGHRSHHHAGPAP